MMSNEIKVYLDDERPTPEGWIGARWPSEVIKLLETDNVTHLSLDHDLGGWKYEKEPTGMDVLTWLEEKVGTGEWTKEIPVITLHTANPVARQRMRQVLHSIIRLKKNK